MQRRDPSRPREATRFDLVASRSFRCKSFLLCYLSLSLSQLGLAGCSGCMAPRSPTESSEPQSSATTPIPATTAVSPSAEGPAGESLESSASATTLQRVTVDRPVKSGKAGEGESDDDSRTVVESTPDQAASSPVSSQPPAPQGRGKRPADVESSVKAVGTLREKAQRAASHQDLGKAFQMYAEAWDTARMHPSDGRLRKAVEEIASELDSLGQQLNTQYRRKTENASIRLIEK